MQFWCHLFLSDWMSVMWISHRYISWVKNTWKIFWLTILPWWGFGTERRYLHVGKWGGYCQNIKNLVYQSTNVHKIYFKNRMDIHPGIILNSRLPVVCPHIQAGHNKANDSLGKIKLLPRPEWGNSILWLILDRIFFLSRLQWWRRIMHSSH